jgi:hypothetical protein
VNVWHRKRPPDPAVMARDKEDADLARIARTTATEQLWRELSRYADTAVVGQRLRNLQENNHFSDLFYDAFRDGEK